MRRAIGLVAVAQTAALVHGFTLASTGAAVASLLRSRCGFVLLRQRQDLAAITLERPARAVA